jgi:hypothetical protein
MSELFITSKRTMTRKQRLEKSTASISKICLLYSEENGSQVSTKSYRNNQQEAKMQSNSLFQYFLIAQHLSSDTPLIIKSSKTVIAASGFTYVCDCWQLSYLSGNAVKKQ